MELYLSVNYLKILFVLAFYILKIPPAVGLKPIRFAPSHPTEIKWFVHNTAPLAIL